MLSISLCIFPRNKNLSKIPVFRFRWLNSQFFAILQTTISAISTTPFPFFTVDLHRENDFVNSSKYNSSNVYNSVEFYF